VTLPLLLIVTLVAVECLLFLGTLSRRPRLAATSRVAIFIVPILLAVFARATLAFSTAHIFDWDETYYVNIGVTAARGSGLYPYLFGFEPTRVMGGIGYAAYSYALAVKLFGPTVLGLRAVALCASVLAIVGIWMVTRAWYGSGAAWIAAAITPSLRLFALSNSARMDSWAFAYVTWALAMFAAASHRRERRWHVAAGFVFGLGLEFHIDTIVTAAACGCVYLVRYARASRETRRFWRPRDPLFCYVTGLVGGIGVYVCANILPDPTSYYITTALVRVDAMSTYASGTRGLLGSFVNPAVLLTKEAARYRQLFGLVSSLELVVGGSAVLALFLRRTASDATVRLLVLFVPLVAGIVLNNPSPLYFIHVLPALILPIAPLFSHGLSRRSTVALRELTPRALLASIAFITAICAGSTGRAMRTAQANAAAAETTPAVVERVRATIDRHCRVAADAGFYVPYLTDYPYFISLREIELKHGMLFHRTTDEAAYWRIKQPDAIVATSSMRPGLAQYANERGFVEVEPDIWISPTGCRGGG
jgi:hypothetical protein